MDVPLTLFLIILEYGIITKRYCCRFVKYIRVLTDCLIEGEEKDIKQARRRLSVMSDNKLVEGFADAVNLDDEEVCDLVSVHAVLFSIFWS